MEIAFVLSEVPRRPILACFTLLLFIPPLFRMLLFFSPLLLSTALCVLALVRLGPHRSATENSGTHPGKDMFDGHVHVFPNEDWQPDLENEQEISTILQYTQWDKKQKQSNWDSREVPTDQWQDDVAKEDTNALDKDEKNVEEAGRTGAPKIDESMLEKDDMQCPGDMNCSLDCASTSHKMSDRMEESPTDEKETCEEDQGRHDLQKERNNELDASAVARSREVTEDVCNSGNKNSCEASQPECKGSAEAIDDGSGRHKSEGERRRYRCPRTCSLDFSASIYRHEADLSSHDLLRGYETSFDPWESSMWARDFMHEEANIQVTQSV